MWEIIDNNGTIYSGSEDEIRSKFQQMVDGNEECGWDGDLKLIQVHSIYK